LLKIFTQDFLEMKYILLFLLKHLTFYRIKWFNKNNIILFILIEESWSFTSSWKSFMENFVKRYFKKQKCKISDMMLNQAEYYKSKRKRSVDKYCWE